MNDLLTENSGFMVQCIHSQINLFNEFIRNQRRQARIQGTSLFKGAGTSAYIFRFYFFYLTKIEMSNAIRI